MVALFCANSPWEDVATIIGDIEAGVVLDELHFTLSIREWVNSGLMALFFFLIGLELKREVLAGHLKHPKHVSLVFLAAMGGMIVPPLIYWGINHGTPGAHGWAIPMATDTAFAIGVLALVARRVSYGISVFLTAMAIFDDIGAIAIIAVFYSEELNALALLLSAATLAVLFVVNVMGVRRGAVYAVLGIILWGGVFASGLHATLAGLLMAVFAPARTRLGETGFVEETRALIQKFEIGLKANVSGMLGAPDQHALAQDMENTVRAASTPLQRWEALFIYPIGIVVLPFFALFNAGVSLSAPEVAEALSSPVTLGIMAGLVIGKPLGVVLFALVGSRLKAGKLPQGMNLGEVVAAGLLAGIGFTMSIFVTFLSFGDDATLISDAKIGIIFASLISATLALAWILLITRKRA